MAEPRPVMAGREMVVVSNVDGCALCGIERKAHGQRQGLGHLGDSRKGFVQPSDDLRERRKGARREPTTGLPYGGFRPDGEVATHLVQAACRCGATVMATPEQTGNARCSACLTADIKEKGTSRA